uniref:DUF4806 domain-containing protein n=1 Tax=Anopheles minimus TaxID=112268 RepID=A0A182WK97_9DIPT
MLPSKRDNRTALEQGYDCGQEEVKIKLEYVPEDEQEHDVLATTDDALLANLKTSCSDSEDTFEESTTSRAKSHVRHANKPTEITGTTTAFAMQNESFSNEFTGATVANMFRSLLESVKKVHTATDIMCQEVTNVSQRLERVEKKVGISLATLETVKDGMVMDSDVSENEISNESTPSFVFKKISNKEEFLEFDSKLGNDREYYSNVKKWLKEQINENDPNNRMLAAMDLMIERTFFAQCNWTGASFDSAPKTAFRERTNVLKLFRVIGSNQSEVLNDSTVEKFFRQRLKNAKRRLTNKGLRKPACRKRKRTGEPSKR